MKTILFTVIAFLIATQQPPPKSPAAIKTLVISNLNPNYQRLVRNAIRWAAGKL
jgi:hypothetical protein